MAERILLRRHVSDCEGFTITSGKASPRLCIPLFTSLIFFFSVCGASALPPSFSTIVKLTGSVSSCRDRVFVIRKLSTSAQRSCLRWAQGLGVAGFLTSTALGGCYGRTCHGESPEKESRTHQRQAAKDAKNAEGSAQIPRQQNCLKRWQRSSTPLPPPPFRLLTTRQFLFPTRPSHHETAKLQLARSA